MRSEIALVVPIALISATVFIVVLDVCLTREDHNAVANAEREMTQRAIARDHKLDTILSRLKR